MMILSLHKLINLLKTTSLMKSLNKILEDLILGNKGYYDHYGITLEFDFDPDMPEIYPDWQEQKSYRYILKMINELAGEQVDARLRDSSLTKLRFGTLYVDGKQVIIIDHNGKMIPEDVLSTLNSKLDLICATRETVNPGGRGGNLRAAIQISDHGGRINIRNFPYREYKVETTVEL